MICPRQVFRGFAIPGKGVCIDSFLKQFLIIDKEDIVFGNNERRTSQILHAYIIFPISQLLRHPFLGISQRHTIRNDKDEAQPLGRGSYMNQDYQIENADHLLRAGRLLACVYLLRAGWLLACRGLQIPGNHHNLQPLL